MSELEIRDSVYKRGPNEGKRFFYVKINGDMLYSLDRNEVEAYLKSPELFNEVSTGGDWKKIVPKTTESKACTEAHGSGLSTKTASELETLALREKLESVIDRLRDLVDNLP